MKNIMSEDAHSQQIPSRATIFLNLIYLKMLYIIEFQFVYFVNVVGIYSSGKSYVLLLGALIKPLLEKNSNSYMTR